MLRQAVRADVRAIQAIRHAVKEKQLRSAVVDDQDVIAALVSTGQGWLLESNGSVVGFGIANWENRSIWALLVDPEHEGKGYGRQILKAMETWLWSCGTEPGIGVRNTKKAT